MDKMKAFSTEQLIHIANKNRHCNTGPTDACLNNLNPNGWHVIEPLMLHNDVELRCRVAMCFKEDDEPVFIHMDISHEDYAQGHDPEHILAMANALNQRIKTFEEVDKLGTDPPDMADPDDQLPEDGG